MRPREGVTVTRHCPLASLPLVACLLAATQVYAQLSGTSNVQTPALKEFWLGMSERQIRAVAPHATCLPGLSCDVRFKPGHTFAEYPAAGALLFLSESSAVVYSITYYLDGSTWGEACSAVAAHAVFGRWKSVKTEDGCERRSQDGRYSISVRKTGEELIEVSLYDEKPVIEDQRKRDAKRSKDM